MLEKFVPFKMEVSVIASRNTKGANTKHIH